MRRDSHEIRGQLSLALAWLAVFIEIAAPIQARAELRSQPLYQFADIVPVAGVALWLVGGVAAVVALRIDRGIGQTRTGFPPGRLALQIVVGLAFVYAGFASAFEYFGCYSQGG